MTILTKATKTKIGKGDKLQDAENFTRITIDKGTKTVQGRGLGAKANMFSPL